MTTADISRIVLGTTLALALALGGEREASSQSPTPRAQRPPVFRTSQTRVAIPPLTLAEKLAKLHVTGGAGLDSTIVLTARNPYSTDASLAAGGLVNFNPDSDVVRMYWRAPTDAGELMLHFTRYPGKRTLVSCAIAVDLGHKVTLKKLDDGGWPGPSLGTFGTGNLTHIFDPPAKQERAILVFDGDGEWSAMSCEITSTRLR